PVYKLFTYVFWNARRRRRAALRCEDPMLPAFAIASENRDDIHHPSEKRISTKTFVNSCVFKAKELKLAQNSDLGPRSSACATRGPYRRMLQGERMNRVSSIRTVLLAIAVLVCF